MRYQVRWNNGYWKVFDRMMFADVAKCFTQRDAILATLDFNVEEAKLQRRAGKRR